MNRDVWCGAAMRLFIKKVLHRQSGLSAQRFRAMVQDDISSVRKNGAPLSDAPFAASSLYVVALARDQRDSPN
ncbi:MULTISPECIES: hypothetical protein [Paraburkholderia]|uniref:hypothetical protein n=1 Tax=Paraburkholderia TaxID=1822464 RepID=UPI00141EDECA|nr:MULTISPECIES: hypothetical protein [Paraburkholderia]